MTLLGHRIQGFQGNVRAHTPTWVVPEGAAGRDGGVEAGHLEVGVGGRRAVALHVDQPGRRRALVHTQSLTQRVGKLACAWACVRVYVGARE